jgi:pimeloyl-ACP methyl ester carboxylesterase
MPLFSFVDGQVFAEVPADEPRMRVAYLHGWGRSRADFGTLTRLRPGVAFDLPGFGSSPPPLAAIGTVGYAELVSKALNELAPGEQFVLVGHSFGGRVVLGLAASNPDQVHGIIVAGTPLFRTNSRKPALKYRLARKLHRTHVLSDGRMERIRDRYGSADYRSSSGVMREILVRVVNESYEEQLRLLQCPTYFLWGRQDSAASIDNARQAVRLVDGATLCELNGGHDVHLEHPEAFIKAIDRIDGLR